MSVPVIFVSMSLAGLFLLSSLLKIRDFSGFRGHLLATLPLRKDSSYLWAGSVIASEVVAALALLVVRPRWIGLAMSFVLLGLFTLYLLKLLWSDDRVSCGCAGAGGNPVSWIHVVRNVVLMVLTGAAWLCTPTNGVSLAAHLTLAVPAAAVGVLLLYLDEIVTALK